MPTRYPSELLEKATLLSLGKSAWRRLGQDEVAAFDRATAAPPSATVPQFLLLSLLPGLLREVLEIEGAPEQWLMGIEQARFALEVDIGAEVQLEAVLLNARRTEEGHLECRIGCSVMTRVEEFPAALAEVLLLAGSG